MPDKAAFTINGNASANRGYVATSGQVLACALEDSSVTSATFEVVSTTGGDPTLGSAGILSPVTGELDITLPATDFDSFMIRCTVTYQEGTRTRTEAFERIVAVKGSADEVRKILPGETTQYDPVRGWTGAVNAALARLVGPAAWTPADIPNAFWWSKGISDPSLRTMSGARVDVMQNGIPNGLVLTRSAGNPTIDVASNQNGFNPLVLDSTAELLSATGGPVGTEEHCIIVLARWTSTTAEGVFRCGAKDACNAVGLTTSSRFAGGRPLNDGVPRIDSPEPVADGAMRAISAHRKPSMTNGSSPYNFVRIDGRAPIAASGATWAYAAAHPSLDGSFGHGRSSAGATANTSLVYDTVAIKGGDISASDFTRLLEYWQARFGWADAAPMIHWSGDSITNGDDLGSPTTERYTATTLVAVNAQCALEGRPTVSAIQNSLGGKRVGGAWNASNVPMTFQASGAYQNPIIANGAEGIHYSAPFSRSGARRWDIYSLMGLTNDIVADEISVDEAKSRMRQCVASYRSCRGFVLLWTPITGSSGSWTAPREAKRQEIITWMTGDFLAETNGPHRVVNCELAGLVHPTDFVAGIPGNLHPNAAGHDKLTAVGWPILMQMIRDIDNGDLTL